MDTSKSINETNGGFYNNQGKEPDYLSGKVIDGLNGKLFTKDKISYESATDKNQESDFDRER
ncbi:MAG: hypothetical protein RSF34_18225 [Flavobacterium sp.]|uniref:hypothetical protein n=1 Tax=Flavobacterium sp. TaxID=239 RepID=UPI002FCA56D1